MYILSGKGSVAGVDLASTLLMLCQNKGILWDNDLPEYTLDFATKIPSVSKSIRDGNANIVADEINKKLEYAELEHNEYMLLCLTAHKLLPRLRTKMQCLDLWDEIEKVIFNSNEKIAFIGTLESIKNERINFLTLQNHQETIGDLITSVKRGYSQLGNNYAAHPQRLLSSVVNQFHQLGAKKFFLACTDLHACKEWLIELGIGAKDIISTIDIAANVIVNRKGRVYDAAFADSVSDAKTLFRYKYVIASDAPQIDKKTQYLNKIISKLPRSSVSNIKIIDIGGSSTGHSLLLAKHLTYNYAYIALLDISKASLDAAKSMHELMPNIKTDYVNDCIENYKARDSFDAALCVGVLLYISCDITFMSVVKKISNLIKRNGILITRDCLHDNNVKVYMAFGGVIRNRSMYENAFIMAGFVLIDSNEFILEDPIQRCIVSSIWRKQ